MEAALKPAAADFVAGVFSPVCEILRRRLDQVADIMQQRCDHQRVGCIRRLCEMRSLQTMFDRAHRFAEISRSTAARIDRYKLVSRRHASLSSQVVAHSESRINIL
jgi:hypothetical protein